MWYVHASPFACTARDDWILVGSDNAAGKRDQSGATDRRGRGS